MPLMFRKVSCCPARMHRAYLLQLQKNATAKLASIGGKQSILFAYLFFSGLAGAPRQSTA